MKKILLTISFMFMCVTGYQLSISADEVQNETSDDALTENADTTGTEIQTNENPTVMVTQETEEAEPMNGLYYENGAYTYYKEDRVDTGYIGFATDQNTNQMVFIKNGQSDSSFTGIAKNHEDGKWYFSRNGQVDTGFTGVAKCITNNKWYHVKNGVLDWKFTGLSKSVTNNKWYYSRNGVLDWNYTGVAKSVANNEWYHVKNGALDWNFTGLSKNGANNQWYFSRKGKLDWKFTGVAKSVTNNEWYHAYKGKLDWNFTGLSKSVSNDKYYYSKKGKLDWQHYGTGKNIDDKKIYSVAAGQQFWDSQTLSTILKGMKAPSLQQLKQLAWDKYRMNEQSFIITLGWLVGDNLEGQDDFGTFLSACCPINAFRKNGAGAFVSEYTSWGSYYSWGNYVYRANHANDYLRKVMYVALTCLDTRPTEANGMCIENGYYAHSIDSAIYKVRYRSGHILPNGTYDGWFGVWSY